MFCYFFYHVYNKTERQEIAVSLYRHPTKNLCLDILCTRDDIYYNNYNLFSLDEVQIMIDHVCMN